jgi:hypothetical protein
MIDVKSKRCEHVGCDKQPGFDIKGGKGRFCASHKTIEMIDVKNKRCEHVGCLAAQATNHHIVLSIANQV